MANSHHIEPDSSLEFLNNNTRYIVVGVEDNSGDIAGTQADIGPYTSILEVDSATPQNTITDYLTPKPNVEIQKFQESGPPLVLISIEISDDPPVTVNRQLDDYLARGDVYVRDGDRNKPAYRSDYVQFVEYKLEQMREYITEGIMKLDLNSLHNKEGRVERPPTDEDAVPFRPSDEGPTIQSRLQTPVELDSLQQELYADLTKWRERSNYHCGSNTLYDYYINAHDLDFGVDALKFAAQSSWNNRLPGGYWVYRMEGNHLVNLISRTSVSELNAYSKIALGRLLSQCCSRETIDAFIGAADMNTNTYQSHGSRIQRFVSEDGPDEVLASTVGGTIDFDTNEVSSLNPDELQEEIRSTAEEIVSGNSDRSGLRKQITNLEIFLLQDFTLSDETDGEIRSLLN